MIRPEAQATLRRWREALAGAAIAAAGVWLAAGGLGLRLPLGLALIGVGTVLAVAGLRRARFRTEAQAPGVVEVVEGQVAYFGPVLGGTVALDTLAEIAFRRTAPGEGFWRLTPASGAAVFVPEGAKGSDALLDAFAPLPGFDGGAMVRAVRADAAGTTIVWSRPARAALT